MMRKYIFLPHAEADMEEIWLYTLNHWTENQADIYIKQITAAIETVVLEPVLARSCDDIREGYWKYKAGSHFIYFRFEDDIAVVVRVLHSRMDPKRHM